MPRSSADMSLMQRGTPPVRVSTIELFFDLVFVFTITQITAVMEHSPDAAGVGHAALELSVIFWMYGGFAWLTNTNDPNTPLRRGLVLAGMAAFFVVSLSVSDAFGDAGIAFGIAYLAVILVHAAGFLLFQGRAAFGAVPRFLPTNLTSAGLVLAAGFTSGAAATTLWVVAALLQIATPFAVRLERAFAINTAHFGERHGLVILIVLGESLVGVALASEGEHVTVRLVVGALTGLIVLSAMWWLYFGADDERAVEAMENAPAHRRPLWAITGYFLAHYVMIFGVLLLAAGVRLPHGDLLVEASTTTAWFIAAGPAAFALGCAGFRLALNFANPLPRAVAGAVCLLTPPLGTHVSIAAQLCVLTVLLVAPLAVERRIADAGPRRPAPPSARIPPDRP